MKKLIVDLKTGKIDYLDLPYPSIEENEVIIKSIYSIPSVGTEKMLLNFSKSNPYNKIKSQPEKFQKVIEKFKTDGVIETARAVVNKLNTPLPLGYSNVGEVLESKSPKFKIGDRVISNSSHSEINICNHSMICKVPQNVSNENAAFTVISSIALHGIRSIKPQIDENIFVVGLGLIGLISCKILMANGCNVIAADIDDSKCQKAREFGIEVINTNKTNLFSDIILANTNSKGSDKTVISAYSNDQNLMNEIIRSTIKGGSIVMVGDIKMNFSRDELYKKEISFRVSSSYGPGRYNNLYEKQNYDYPIEYIRWTANRNFQSILNLLKFKKIDFIDLIDQKIHFNDLKEFYKTEKFNKSLGILVEYNEEIKKNKKIEISNNKNFKLNNLNVALIGTGNYANKFIIPELYKNKNVNLISAVSKSGVSAGVSANKFNFTNYSSDYQEVLNDDNINTVFICTQHNRHFEIIIKAIEKDKNIYVEKPLCINQAELSKIKNKIIECNYNKLIYVGFNRRHAPITYKIKNSLVNLHGNSNIIYTINAGQIDQDHWVNNKSISGGRIISEIVHFLDFIIFLENSLIKSFKVTKSINDSNNVMITLELENNSLASINYITNGNKKYSKEKIQIFKHGKIFDIDNFKKFKSFGLLRNFNSSYWNQNKGNTECLQYFISNLLNDNNFDKDLYLEQIINSHSLAFQIEDDIK